MEHNETYIGDVWQGQDGCEYRVKNIWIGVGYKQVMQKFGASGWMNV